MSASYTTRPTRHRLLIGAVALALMAGLMPAASNPVRAATSVFINEIHYDNAGTDAGEAIEIEGEAGTDLAGYSIVLYNGNGGAPYATVPLGGIIGAACDTRGVLVFGFPENGIQNGAPDGMALVAPDGAVIEFLSYEGTMTAVGGPADGLVSTDIVASQNNAVPGTSLQRTSSGVWRAN